MPKPKLAAQGINLGGRGSYLRSYFAQRIRALITLAGQPGVEELEYAGRLFSLTDERIEAILQREELQAAAREAFPEQCDQILEIYHYALSIAQFRHSEADIRNQESIETLLRGEVTELYESLRKFDAKQIDRAEVDLRLASVVYYSVQNLNHEVRYIAGANLQVILNDTDIVLGINHVAQKFREELLQYSQSANRSVTAGIEAARRKFGSRVLLRDKNSLVERLLMDNLPQ
jgi:hypothetical protein